MRKMSLLLLAIIITIAVVPDLKAQVNVGDSLALVNLYDSTNGRQWSHNTNWLTTNPVSTWYGVWVKNNRVDSINLYSNKLKGKLPSSVGNLTNLTGLNLAGNNFYLGSIPSTIGTLVNLIYLDLSGSQFTGIIPTTIGNCTALTYIDLSNNLLTGSIPSTLGNCTALTHLTLASIGLSGSIPAALGNCTRLAYLNLSVNKLSESIPDALGNCTRLYFFDVWSNELSDTIPATLGNWKMLQTLDLSYNKLTGRIPASIGNCTVLEDLDMSSNQLSDTIPAGLFNCKLIYHLDLSKNQLTGNIPSAIGNLSKLTELYLANNQLSGSIPSSLGNCADLTFFDLTLNQLSDSIPSSLGNCKNLFYVYLSFNKLSGSIPAAFGGCSKLVQLNLYNNQLSGNIPTELGNCSALAFLNLGFNYLNGSIPKSLSNCTKLNGLILSNNKFTDSIPASFLLLPNCSFFLANNDLTGGLPITSGTVTSYFYINTNRYNFSAFEQALSKYAHLDYIPQKNIPIHQNGTKLSVTAGGTLGNNTYNWYKDGILMQTINGDSVYTADSFGKYYAKITNSLVPLLILQTDTLDLTSLPVNFISFSAAIKNNDAVLNWKTAQEINVARYNVQRSTDGTDFTTIGTIEAKGAQQNNYSYTDLHVTNLPVKTFYYRIQEQDADGKVQLSNVQMININTLVNKIYPSPAKDVIHIILNNEGYATIQVYDAPGKIVKRLVLNSQYGKTVTINIADLAAGIYYLEIKMEGIITKQQFIKQ